MRQTSHALTQAGFQAAVARAGPLPDGGEDSPVHISHVSPNGIQRIASQHAHRTAVSATPLLVTGASLCPLHDILGDRRCLSPCESRANVIQSGC